MNTSHESKSDDTVPESHPSLCELTVHVRVFFSRDYNDNNVISLQPAVYPYLHHLIYQQSPHHLLLKLLVCHCVCNLSANVIPCGVVMLCIAIANLKWCLDIVELCAFTCRCSCSSAACGRVCCKIF